MAIVASQILFYYPQVSSEGGNHGGTCVDTEVVTTKNGLWDDVSGAQAAAGTTEYRKVFVGVSDTVADVLSSAVAWIASTTPATGDAIWLKSVTAATDAGNVRSQVTSVAAQFKSALTAKAVGVDLGNISSGVGNAAAVWMARVVAAGAGAQANNSGILRVEGETS